MAYVFDGRKVAPEDSGDKDTLKGRMSQIKINKDMTSERNMMDFFLENEEDLEDSTPTPQRQQQCCNAPNIVQMDEHTEQCQKCGSQSAKLRFEHHQPGEQKTTCNVPLKRKKGQFCKSKPGKDGLCWRHSKQPRQQEEETIPVEGKMVVKETMKTLRQIAKDEGLRGVSRKNKEALVKLIEEKTIHKFARQEVFSKKQLKSLAKNRGLTKYSHLKRDDLIQLVEEDIKNAPVEDEIKVIDRREALNGVFGTVVIEPAKPHDVTTFLKVSRSTIASTILDALTKKKALKVQLVLQVEMVKTNPATGENIYVIPHFRSTLTTITESDDLELEIAFMMEKVKENMAKYMREGSGWTFSSVEKLEIHLNQFKPLKGASFIPTPSALAKKKAIVNVKNEDDRCFQWAVLAALYHEEVDQKSTNRVSQYKKWEEELKFEGIDFPVSLRAIDKFERQNSAINVNVYGFDGVKKGEDEEEDLQIYPLRISKNTGPTHVDLLFLTREGKQHYCWIKSLSRLLSSQISERGHELFFCRRCLSHFSRQDILDEHMEYCSKKDAVRIEMPEEGTTIAFHSIKKMMRVPFAIYADFECFTEKLDTCQPDPSHSYTNAYQLQRPSGFCYHVKYAHGDYKDPVVYCGEDAAKKFVQCVEEEVQAIAKLYKENKPMELTDDDKVSFAESTHCHICGDELGEDKVRDHDHLTGKYRGAAHNQCNLDFQLPKHVPILFHNLSGYDAHIFVKELGHTEGKINCIPNTDEKYISFSKQVGDLEMRFIDSCRFMLNSLDTLAKNLTPVQFATVKTRFGDRHELMIRKGVFPYDYMDGPAKLEETQLPPKEAFFSTLSGEHISDKDYAHAQRVWETFECKTLRDYHDLYLETDVLLLTDIFENFRDICMANYGLDPAHYFTSPGLSYDAALKTTGQRLELLSDPDMLMMFEQATRGGVAMISHRQGKANNPYMESYDSSQPIKYLTYLDANNLYGWAMAQPLPTGDFEWVEPEEIDEILSYPDDHEYGAMVECDLEYPEELHDAHNDYPLAPENVEIGKVRKLVPHLGKREKYTLHYRNLKMYLEMGMKLTKCRRIIRFKQSPWLKHYIDLNTAFRAKAKTDSEKDFFKLMVNSVFGKTMENIRKRVDVRLVTTEKQALKLVAKPNFDRRVVFTENLAAVHMKKTKLKFDKPIYLGACILDISKLLMYDFHYGFVRKTYGSKARLLFTDTDSLAYEIQTDDFYQDITPHVEAKFDTSNYPPEHPSGIPTGKNKKVLGMFKDECGGKTMTDFVGLRAKLYAFRMDDGKAIKKAKGVTKSVIKRSIAFEDYKRCLDTQQEIHRPMNILRSHLHQIYAQEINKIALSAKDDKRHILPDGISTLSHGHYRITHG
ncbi:uncharacterized protein LOC134704824 [Mytilus trossulus]|uniref:uncharacterized protein LOC134704824 n=1 Tax=Mytilus trossulus TaxID=6551 RepID=UPI00300773B1